MIDPTTMSDSALTSLLADCIRVLAERAAARPVCALCGTDADAPTVERLLMVPHTVHAACSAVSDHTPEPGDAIDRLPDFIEAHLPDAPEGSLRHTTALSALAREYPGILTIAAALKAAQPNE